jgi:hypothetical protein
VTVDEAIAKVVLVFSGVPRPELFIRGTCHCCECMEHNQTLASHTPETIGMDELGNPGWDPICFASDPAFVYYMPAMVRLALSSEYYVDQFLFHLNISGRVDVLNAEQASAVLQCLWVVQEKFEKEIALCDDEHRVEEAMKRLERVIGAAC